MLRNTFYIKKLRCKNTILYLLYLSTYCNCNVALMRRWPFNVQLLLWVPSDHLWALPDPSHCCWSYPAISNSTDRNAPWGQRSLPWGPTDQPWGQTTPALRRSSSTGLRTTSTRGTDNHPSQRLMLICRTIVRNCLSANLTAGLGSCHLLWMRWWMAGKPLLEILWVEHIAKDVVSVEIFKMGGGRG